MQRILDTLLQKQSFDLVTIEDNAMGVYNYSTRAPLVFTEHEVRRPRPINWHAGVPSNWLRWVFCEADWYRWQRYQPLIWRRFDRVQVFTSRDAKAITALAPDLAWRVRINPFGIELPAPVDYSLEEEGNVLFVGNFTHPPNVDAALWLGAEIMPLLRTRYPGIRLTLVGIYPPKAVQALACDDIFVIGPVPEIEPFFKRAAVIVAPLRTGGGMRMKVLQAMALGKAVVTTHRGADGLSLTGQQPPLTIADSAEEIADAVKVLLESSNIRQSIGLRARDHVAEYFSAQAYARRIESIYAELRPGQGAP